MGGKIGIEHRGYAGKEPVPTDVPVDEFFRYMSGKEITTISTYSGRTTTDKPGEMAEFTKVLYFCGDRVVGDRVVGQIEVISSNVKHTIMVGR